jgi:hypothetical protein
VASEISLPEIERLAKVDIIYNSSFSLLLATDGEPGGRAREKIGSGYEFKHFKMRNAFIHDRPHNPRPHNPNTFLKRPITGYLTNRFYKQCYSGPGRVTEHHVNFH